MNDFTRTHDGQLVYPAGHDLPTTAHGWIQCDNRGGGYATWLATEDRERAKQDLSRLEQEAKALRTRVQCEAALRELGLQEYQIGGTCRSMRDLYCIVGYRNLWPLRQVS